MEFDIFESEIDIGDDLILELKKVINSSINDGKIIPLTSQRHYIAYNISLYTLSILNQLISHIERENLLDSLEEKELINSNKKSLDVIYKSFYSLKNAMAIKNYSFAMRIINTICKTITVSTALNTRDKKGDFSVFQSYLDEKNNKVFELNENCSEVEYLEKFRDYFSDYDKRNFLSTPDFTHFDTKYHPWLYKYFNIKDPKHRFVKFQPPIAESIKYITYQDVDKVITKGYQNYSLDFSDAYLSNNFGDFYFDSISPVTGGYEFPDLLDPFEDKGTIIPLINNLEVQCIHSIIDTINYLPYYLETIPSLEKITPLFSSYVIMVLEELYDDSQLSYSSENEYFEILEREVFNYISRNKDPMVIKMILGKVKIVSQKDKEEINKYFSTYKDVFLNNNDICLQLKNVPSNETCSINLALKYQNLFKSIENAYWYRSGDNIASCMPLGEYKERIENLSGLDDKLIFFGGEESGRSEKFLTNIFFERKIMSFLNICNSILIGDKTNAIREVKKLYETIISHIYIIFKEFNDEGVSNADKLIPSLLIYMDNCFVNSHNGVDTWRDVRKILSKIQGEEGTFSPNDSIDNLSDEELDELTLSAFEELLDNDELSIEKENPNDEEFDFDEKELINAMEGDDENFKKYLKKFVKLQSAKIDSKEKKNSTKIVDNLSSKDRERELLEEEKIIVDSLKDIFPELYEKILKTDITKELCWVSEKDIENMNDLSKFLDSKIAISPILLDFDRIVANHFATIAPFFNDREVSDTELSLLILDCSMLIVQTLEIDMRMVSNSKVDILPVLKTFTYIIKSDLKKMIKKASK